MQSKLLRSNNTIPFIIIGFISLASAALSIYIVSQAHWIDDAFISFRYARNLVEGQGLVFNPGERIEGYTNFLWTVIAAFSLRIGFEPILFSQVISVAAQVLTIWLVYFIGVISLNSRLRALVAPLLLAFNDSFFAYSMTGMETTFFTLLITLSVWLLLKRESKSSSSYALIALTLLLMSLTRFDGLGIAMILIGYIVIVERPARSSLAILALFFVSLVMYNLWRLGYYPTPLPHTFYAKVSFSGIQLLKGIKYLFDFFLRGGWFYIPFVALAIATRLSRSSKLIAGVITVHLGYIIVVGGDWMPKFRFILPVLPLIFLITQEGVWNFHNRTLKMFKEVRIAKYALVSILIFFVGIGISPIFTGKLLNGVSASWFEPQDAKVIGEYLDEHIDHDLVLAIEWGGIMPFYTHQAVIDTFGITDQDIVAQDFPASTVGRMITPEYLASRSPDIIAPCARLFQSEEAALKSVEDKGACDYRFYLDLAGPDTDYEYCLMKIEENSYWVAVTKRIFDHKDQLCLKTFGQN